MTLLKGDSVWKLQAVPHSHDLGQEMFLAFERLNLSFKTVKSNFITKGEHQKIRSNVRRRTETNS